MRKNINGLCEIVQHHFQLDPTEKFIFGFCNNQRNRVKLLVWDDNGFIAQLSSMTIVLDEVVPMHKNS